MKYRMLGTTGFKVSEIGLGTWQVGGRWGSGFDANIAHEILETAINRGVTFFDTADVYEAGASEAAVGKLKRAYASKITIASKCGRGFQPHTSEMYTTDGLRKFVESTLINTGLETIDLMQLHCPPSDIYYKPEFFEFFSKLKTEGKILNFGVSVERVEEALKAIEYDVVSTVQIIINMFRQRPTELFFEQAKKRKIGVIARVPLASGLLTGKFSSETKFTSSDHRYFNRDGKVFDKGETFSGVPFDVGLKAIERIKNLFPEAQSLSQLSLRWILMFDAVSTIIPGASDVTQLNSNVQASDMRPLTLEEMANIRKVYNEDIAQYVHHQW